MARVASDVTGGAGQAHRMASIRVATLLSFPPAPGSGLGAFTLGLFERFEHRPDLELVLIAPDTERGSAGRRVSQALLALRQLWRLLRARPDVVHVHDHPALLAAAVIHKALSRRRVRIVFSSHLDPSSRRALWKRVLLGALLARCSAVTVVAQNSLEKLRLIARPLPSSGIVRIVPGAASVRVREKTDPAVVQYAASIGHRGGPVLLQVSNFLYAAKVAGTLRLMEALVDVRRRIPDARLIVMGTGPLVGRAQAARDRLGLADAVLIPGAFLEDLSLPAALADVHCHITLQDASPIAILEAMHAAKPIVASRTGGIPEMIDHRRTGMLVDNDASQIAQAIVDLLEHPDDARAMGTRARRVAQARFTWDRVAADVEALYRGAPRSPAVEYTEALTVVD